MKMSGEGKPNNPKPNRKVIIMKTENILKKILEDQGTNMDERLVVAVACEYNEIAIEYVDLCIAKDVLAKTGKKQTVEYEYTREDVLQKWAQKELAAKLLRTFEEMGYNFEWIQRNITAAGNSYDFKTAIPMLKGTETFINMICPVDLVKSKQMVREYEGKADKDKEANNG